MGGRDDLSHVTARLHDTSATLKDLQAVLRDEESLDAVLSRLAKTAVKTIPGATAVSVTIARGETGRNARTAACTDESVVLLDEGQYAEGDGPCLEAARTQRPVLVTVEQAHDRWPGFTCAATRAGVCAYLSAPLLLDWAERVQGALNVCARDATAFDSLDEALLTLLTTSASAAIANAQKYLQARELAENMAAALSSRAEIDQAKGVLMARHGVSADDAFELLVRQSQHSNTKLREVAQALLASAEPSSQ